MKKNVLVIMCDQLRKDFLGCYGNAYVNTPNIDSIAAEGLTFDQCFVNNPICMPNRMSMFTGMYPHNHGMWTNGLMPTQELPTIADAFKQAGYETCSIGKLHFEPTDCFEHSPEGSREDHRAWERKGDDVDWTGPYWGFEHVEFTIGHATKPIAHYGKWFHANGGTDDMAKAKSIPPFESCPVTTMPEKLHDSTFIGERCAQYIKNNTVDGKPFFLVASFPDPHHPFNPPYETAMRYVDAVVKTPVAEDDTLATRPIHYYQHKMGAWHRAGVIKEIEGMTEEERRRLDETIKMLGDFMKTGTPTASSLLGGESSNARGKASGSISSKERDERIRNTYAMVNLIDQGVGKILSALQEARLLEDTIILFTSDHGELMGDHGLWLKGPFFYDGLLNVPLIVRIPGRKTEKTSELASTVDIFPTLCELAGIETPRYLDGVPLVDSNGLTGARTKCLVEYRNGYFKNDIYSMGIIDSKYKFIQYQNGDCELTDRRNDPEELLNTANIAGNEKIVSQYREKLLMTMLETGSKFPNQICNA